MFYVGLMGLLQLYWSAVAIIIRLPLLVSSLCMAVLCITPRCTCLLDSSPS